MAPKQSRADINVPRVLGQLAAMPLDECVQMRGKASLQGRFKDSADLLWSHDRHGRWFAKINGKTVWLGRKLARLRYGCAPVPSNLKASHNCSTSDSNPNARMCSTESTMSSILEPFARSCALCSCAIPNCSPRTSQRDIDLLRPHSISRDLK